MIAAELAARLEGDLRADSVGALWEEIRQLCDTHRDLDVGPSGALTGDRRLPFEATDAPPTRPLDPSALRLVTRRRLYDGATTTQRSSSLGSLAGEPAVRLHPEDFAGLGIGEGTPVELSSAKGSVTLAARSDPSVGRGTAVVTSNLAGAEVNRLVSADDPHTDVRLDPGRAS
jgi:anaerobic selenocysteine-containing dehydrogenase